MEIGSRMPVVRPREDSDIVAVLAVIALLGLFVYAYPYVEYALSAALFAKKGLSPRRREANDHSL